MAMLYSSDPQRVFSLFKDEILDACRYVLESGQYILGSCTHAFESDFAAALQLPNCLGVANGTDALEIALRALELRAASPVITVAHTATATVAAIERAGLRPVLVDIEPKDFTISPACVEAAARKLRERGDPASAILAVHLYGHPADMSALTPIAADYDLRIIEDCAQAHGARIGARFTGSLGDAAAFSFYPTKNLGALGDGGACSFADERAASRAALLRQYGWQSRIAQLPGFNSRLDELQAAILSRALKRLVSFNAMRTAIAARYSERLSDLPLELPLTRAGVHHAFHLYVVRTKQRDELKAHLANAGISLAVHYTPPLHYHPAYRQRIEIGDGGLPETEKAADEILSLPMFPGLTAEEIDRVSALIREFFCTG